MLPGEIASPRRPGGGWRPSGLPPATPPSFGSIDTPFARLCCIWLLCGNDGRRRRRGGQFERCKGRAPFLRRWQGRCQHGGSIAKDAEDRPNSLDFRPSAAGLFGQRGWAWVSVHTSGDEVPHFAGGEVDVFGQWVRAGWSLSAEEWTRPRPVRGGCQPVAPGPFTRLLDDGRIALDSGGCQPVAPGPFTALGRGAVLAPALMPGLRTVQDRWWEARSRAFSLPGLEPCNRSHPG